MAKAAPRKRKPASSPRTRSRKAAAKRTVTKAPAAKARPQKPEAPPVSPVERRGLVEAALQAAQATHWNAAAVSTTLVSGVEVRIASVPGVRPLWWLRTHGLFATAGVEVSLRVPRAKDEVQAPAFMHAIVERLIGHAREGLLSPGQIVSWPKPFGDGVETDLTGFAITIDPAFGTIRTAHDVVPVVLAVGVTGDEARVVREWSPQGLLEVFSKVDPTLATTVDRASLLASPRARQAIEQRVEREGSSMGVLIAAKSDVGGKATKTWTIDVSTCDGLLSLLKGRVGHQRPFVVRSANSTVEVTPGDAPGLTVEGKQATLKLTQTAARAMRATLKPVPGTYTWDLLPSFVVEVVDRPS